MANAFEQFDDPATGKKKGNAFAQFDEPSAKVSTSEKPSTGEPQLNAIERGAAERMLGVEETVNNLGIGKHLGLPSNEILQGATGISREQGKAARNNEGTAGRLGTFIGETAGDPLSWMGGSEFAGAKGALSLAKVGAKYGALAGGTEPGAKDIKENLRNATEGAVVGGVASPVLGAATPSVIKGTWNAGKLIKEGLSARTAKQRADALSAIRNESHRFYKDLREANAYIHPEAIKQMQKDVFKKLEETGLFNPQLHRNTLSVLKQLNKASENGISLESLDQHRQLLSEVVNSNTVNGKMNSDAYKASKAIKAIDDAVDELSPEHLSTQNKDAVKALQNARFIWAKARRFEVISDLLEKAGNDPNRRKQLLENFLNNKSKTKGFSDEELNLIRDAMENNTSEALVKMAGKFGISLGGGRSANTGNVLPAVEMMVAGFKKGIPIVVTGTGAKAVQNLMGKAKAERILKAIENRSIPVGENPNEIPSNLGQTFNQFISAQ